MPGRDSCIATKSRKHNGKILVVPDPRHHLFRTPILAQITTDDVLDSAYEWLCRRRRDYSANSDVWSFRREWTHEKKQIRDELRAGSYRFSLLTRITRKDGEEADLRSARDALVLKALAPVLGKHRSCQESRITIAGAFFATEVSGNALPKHR